MPDPAAPFMQNMAPNLLAQANPMPQAGQTLGQGVGKAVQNFAGPLQAILQRYGIKPGTLQPALNATSAKATPVGTGAPAPAPAPASGMPPRPGMLPPGMPGQGAGQPMSILPPGMGY
jgi:hypothetical protein